MSRYLVVMLGLAACSGRAIPTDGPMAPDVPDAPQLPDLPRPADAAVDLPPPPIPCDKICPPPSGGTICLSGRVLEARSLLRRSVDPTVRPTPLTTQDSVVVKLYDPIPLYAGIDSAPRAKANVYNDGGCFIVTDLEVSVSTFVAITVDDKKAPPDDWAFTAFDLRIAPKHNVTLEIPAVSTATAQSWNKDLYKQGSVFLWFLDDANTAVAGATPTVDSKPPPWTAVDCKGDCSTFFFREDISGFVAGAAETTGAGLVAIRDAPWADYSGSVPGKTVESLPAGSSSQMLVFRVLRVF